MINTALLDSLWQGAFVVAIAAIVTGLLPPRHAATRYAVWFAALLALAIVPLVSLWHPAEAFAALPAQVAHGASAPARITARAAIESGTWLMLAWALGVLLSFLRLAISYMRIDRIVHRASSAPHLGTDVMTSDDVVIPIAAGLLSPVVIIPTGIASTLERSDLESVLQHERAHIRRMDVAGNCIQRIVEACLFFNPWAYLIGRQLIKEREAACDDWVVHTMRDPDRYAACLAQLAQGRHSRTPLLTPSATGSRHLLVGRIARLLNGKAAQLKTNYAILALSVASFAILAVVLQTSQGLASTGFAYPAPARNVVATSACTFPHGYTDAKAIEPAPPDIPKSAYRSGLSAGALVTISPQGRPLSAKIVKSSGSAVVDRATVNASMRSTYSPATKACKPVTSQYYFHMQTGP